MIEPGFSAEFPNDNPLLWRAVPWQPEPEGACSGEAEAVSESEAPPVSSVEYEHEHEHEHEHEDDFARFVKALVEVAMARGASRAAAVLPALLGGERVVAEGVPAALLALEFRLAARAWRGAMAGSGDLSECGDTPLDEWAADVLASLLEAPGERAALRRELRAHGVAAFGLLAA